MSHFEQLISASQNAWTNKAPHPALPAGCTLHHDGTRFWWIVNPANGLDIMNWECRPFPGCASLVITTKVVLNESLRGQGLGRYFREFRHRIYRDAGFVGELATVRTDNPAQNRLMSTMGGIRMGEFPSDFGGAYTLWLTSLVPGRTVLPVNTRPEPGPTWTVPTPVPLPVAPVAPVPLPVAPVAPTTSTLPVVSPTPTNTLPAPKPKRFAHRNPQ